MDALSSFNFEGISVIEKKLVIIYLLVLYLSPLSLPPSQSNPIPCNTCDRDFLHDFEILNVDALARETTGE